MDKPLLTTIQRSWLQEIGIDARMLAHFTAAPFVEAEAAVEATVAVKPEEPLQQGESAGPALIADILQRKPLSRSGGQPAPVPRAPSTSAPSQRPSGLTADVDSLQGLRAQAEDCQACGLHEVRGRVVFGEGAESSVQWMFIGEAPGGYDDISGLPFQGRPGDLLRAMLHSVGIAGDAATYFTNVLKCRPIGNRSPQPEEVAACLPLLHKQIQQLQPACLVALGRVAAGALLGKEEELDTLRGKVHQYVDTRGKNIPLIVTHHPASLLLHGQLKAEAWRDLNLLTDLPG